MNDRIYLIPDSSTHSVEIFRSGDHITIHSNHRALHIGSASTGYSLEMASHLVTGLRAVLSGQFDRAVSELYLRLELELTQRARRAALDIPSSSSASPSLESL